MQVPREIENYLTRDEVVEKIFNLQHRRVFATNKRLLVKSGRTVRDYAYHHISSIGYGSVRYYWLVVIGILLVGLGFVWDNGFRWLLFLAGAACFALGLLLKREWLEIMVSGLSQPVRFEGGRQELDTLLTIVRERRV